MKRTLKLVLEYDGTGYCGWQVQPNGVTVQEKIEQAVAQITGSHSPVVASGRTDSGVHARGQVAQVRTDCPMPCAELKRALNAILPEDIAVHSVEDAPPTFHAQKSAKRKTYQYALWIGPDKPVIGRQYMARAKYKLKLAPMRQAARLLVGRHDFRCFCSDYSAEKESRRTIYELTLRRSGNVLFFTVTGNGFLYNMVRAIVGTLIEVGRERMTIEDVQALLKKAPRGKAGPTAPASGLTLLNVQY